MVSGRGIATTAGPTAGAAEQWLWQLVEREVEVRPLMIGHR
jgi:hypothetical protein